MVNFATKMEKAICFAWNNESLPKIGGYDETEEAATSVVAWLRGQGVSGQKAIHFGETNAKTTSLWQSYGGIAKSPAKTDFIIGNHKISLKMGKSQLMSSGGGEATATFNAVISEIINPNEKKIDEIYNLLLSFVSGVCSGTVGKAKKSDPILQEGEKVHKRMTALLSEMIESNDKFGIEFVKEAITGRIKFGDNSDAIPSHMLVVGKGYKLYDLNDDAIYSRIANSIKVDVSFKSSHSKGTSANTYRFWSVVSLAIDKIQEGIRQNRHDLLSEAVVSDMWNKIKGFFMILLEKIKGFLNGGMGNVMEFLEVEPDIKFDNEYEV